MDPLSTLSAVANYVATSRVSGAMATVIATSGSVPQKPGARLAVFADGTTIGTVGGGAIEHEVLRVLREALESGVTERVARHLTKQLGMCCGGEMEFFVEPLIPSPRLVLFGAGHIALPTAKVARAAGFSVCVVDDREELNSPERFPGCEVLIEEGDEAIRRGALSLGSEDYAVICTHSHRLDQEILGKIAGGKQAFFGMVASRRKAKVICDRLELKDPKIDLSGLHSPVGLDIGAIEPGEIALSIVAQLVEVRRKNSGETRAQKSRSNDIAVGIVLAAGASTRMGAPKALLRIGQKTVTQTIADTLTKGGCAEVCVVVATPHGDAIKKAHPTLECVTNERPEDGMLGSVICGLNAARARGASHVVFALLDQPRVRVQTIETLLAEIRQESAQYVVPAHGKRRGHPFVLDAGAPVTLPQNHEQVTLRDALRKLDQFNVVEVDDPFIFDDLDTPEDAERFGAEVSSSEDFESA